jgi:preprotein translocase subunit YajC
MLKNLRKRDIVVTSGGIKGRIVKIRDTAMTLVIDEKKDVRVEVLRSAVVALDQKGDDDDEEDSSEEEKAKDEAKA